MVDEKNDLVPYLFRTEYSKMVSVLVRRFGLKHIEIAEDIVSATFLAALDIWPYKGMPENPAAWLYTVAKNKLKNYLGRSNKFAKLMATQLSDKAEAFETGIDFSEQNITDSQLQMLFAICHPCISKESQICLALRILCGLGLDEIADALLTNKETVHKRLQRAKKKLLAERVRLELPCDREIDERSGTVIQTIYLLFSEGYYSETNNSIVRKELCIEALNLGYLLLESPLTNKHAANSLMSLMCFHASRLDARQTVDGSMVLLNDQDRALWDLEFIEKGFYYLQQASKWEITSTYYIEASIAYWHTVDDTNSDKWPSILKLYDILLQANASPIIALNRIVALWKVEGAAAALRAAELPGLKTSHFYFILLAELHRETDIAKTIDCLKMAYKLCRTDAEKAMIQQRMKEAHL